MKMRELLALGGLILAVSGCCGKSSSCGTEPDCSSGVCGDSTVVSNVKLDKEAEINTAALAVLINSGEAVVLDARGGKYDDGFRIPSGKHLSYKCSAADAATLIPSKGSLVVTYCSHTKCPASKRLAKHLHELGYTNVLEYPVGIAGWKASGRKVVKVK